jgi:hypothetical protein
MRQPEFPLDPDLMAELEAIDATLSGRIVDPEFAELAELTVMVAAERPQLAPDRARALDERVRGRFGPAAPRATGHRSWRSPGWAAGLSAAAVAAVVVIVVAGSGGGLSNGNSVLAGASSSASHSSAANKSSAARNSTSPTGFSGSAAPLRAQKGAKAPATLYQPSSGHGSSKSSSSASGSNQSFAPAGSATNGSAAGPSTPAPTPNARKIIQSAQLQLNAQSRWVDVVAQEVFDVVGQEKGVVRSSQVTAATSNSGYATFNLSIPSANLSSTVTRLSALQHSRVVSRTDGTQDVNGPYLSDQRRLADAQALRTSLLKQLAKATTQAQIDSLQARIHTAEAQINSDQATLHRLQYQISFSQLSVTINGGPVPLPLASGAHSSGGFTIGSAAHDAVKVLTVAAGVALIALAALVPLALLVALIVWVRLALHRRRREQALDAA